MVQGKAKSQTAQGKAKPLPIGKNKGSAKPDAKAKAKAKAQVAKMRAKDAIEQAESFEQIMHVDKACESDSDELAWQMAMANATSCEEVMRLEEARKNGESPPGVANCGKKGELPPDLADMPSAAKKRKSTTEEYVSESKSTHIDSAKADEAPVSMEVDEVPKEIAPPAGILRQDLLSQNLGLIRAVISDKSYQFPGSENCRKMLESMAPLALKAPMEERHPVQEMVVGMLGESFDAAQRAQKEHNSWRFAKVRELEEEVSKTKDGIASVEKQALDKDEEVARLEAAVEDAAAVIQQAQGGIEEAATALANAEAEASPLQDVRQKCDEIMEGSYKMLKEGSWGFDFAEQRKCVQEVCDFLKDLQSVKVPTSLIFVEGPAALRQKPDRRHESAVEIIKELDCVFEKHLAFVDAKIEAGSAELAKCQQVATSVQDALASAQKKSEALVAELNDAKSQRAQVQDELLGLRSRLAAHKVAVQQAEKQADIDLGPEELEKEHWLTEGIAAFRTLRDH